MRGAVALVLFATSVSASAVDVVDGFESGNPNSWAWTNINGGTAEIVPEGGNPGAWADSGVPYFVDHPNFTALPLAGTPLRDALDSGTLHSASIDVQRLDTSAVENCHPIYDLPSMFTLELIDIHSSDSVIEAHTTDGPPSPGGTSFAWMNAGFTIPSDATETPPGWTLNAPPELGYTWADLMHNIDGIRFFVLSPDDITYSACWDLGADNVVVSYGTDDDVIFSDGFEGTPPPR